MTAVNVGATSETVQASHKAIMDILGVRADQATIQLALNCLKSTCSVGDVAFTNCVITNGVEQKEIPSSKGKKST